ncbi:arylsulfatase [Sphingomonas gilva]|uniref:Arylsulfatase n=1 Tax=Sphingomonas gilva TaxID=2305907 RepID=A0A396RTW7_9SPHN|nr:sulfatase [Sphingomonas gilva]RHW18862.1 arylsulfatase [Sphingomonas gilva]
MRGRRSLKLLMTLALTGLATTPASAGQADRPPNIVIVLADDLGYGDVGANGATLIKTPALDRMAAEGVRLTSAYAAANVCTPSRAALLTGRHAIRSGLAENVIHPKDAHGLPAGEVTFAEMLKAHGYRTALIGKWHLGHQPQHHPLRHGFDSFFGLRYSNDMLPLALYEGERAVEEPVDQATLTRRYTDRAIEIVKSADRRPFLIYLAHSMPHVPLFRTRPFEGRSRAGVYGDVVEELDWNMGRLLDALRESGAAENTLVIFTSDNGPWFEGSSGRSRGNKGSSWQGGYRVPFIAWAPGRLPRGRVSDAPVSLLDVMPTIAALSDGQLPDDRPIDGRNVWPVLAEGAASPHDAIYFFNNSQIAAIRKGRWRLVVQAYYRGLDVPLDQFGAYFLYDLERDPGERYSYAAEQPGVLAAMKARLAAARKAFGVPERPPFAAAKK